MSDVFVKRLMRPTLVTMNSKSSTRIKRTQSTANELKLSDCSRWDLERCFPTLAVDKFLTSRIAMTALAVTVWLMAIYSNILLFFQLSYGHAVEMSSCFSFRRL